jgi:hypothetical protein
MSSGQLSFVVFVLMMLLSVMIKHDDSCLKIRAGIQLREISWCVTARPEVSTGPSQHTQLKGVQQRLYLVSR